MFGMPGGTVTFLEDDIPNKDSLPSSEEDEKFNKDCLRQYMEEHETEILQDLDWWKKNIDMLETDGTGFQRGWVTVVPSRGVKNFNGLKEDLKKASLKSDIYIKDEKSKEEIRGYVNGVEASKYLYKQLKLTYKDMRLPVGFILARNKDRIDYMLLLQLRGKNERIMDFIDAYGSLK